MSELIKRLDEIRARIDKVKGTQYEPYLDSAIDPLEQALRVAVEDLICGAEDGIIDCRGCIEQIAEIMEKTNG